MNLNENRENENSTGNHRGGMRRRIRGGVAHMPRQRQRQTLRDGTDLRPGGDGRPHGRVRGPSRRLGVAAAPSVARVRLPLRADKARRAVRRPQPRLDVRRLVRRQAQLPQDAVLPPPAHPAGVVQRRGDRRDQQVNKPVEKNLKMKPKIGKNSER